MTQPVNTALNHIFTKGRLSPGNDVPLSNASLSWQNILTEWVNKPLSEVAPEFIDTETPLPFETVLAVPVSIAIEMLQPTDSLTSDALLMLKRDLLKDLCRMAGQTLVGAFKNSQRGGASRLARLLAKSPDERYQKFVERLHGRGVVSLFETYPTLAHWLCTDIAQWIAHINEILLRFEQDDLSALCDSTPQKIARLQYGLSDAHWGGKTVAMLELSDGQRLIYKPRPLAMEALFNDVIAWVNTQDVSLELKTVPLIDQGDYGWIAFISQADCHDTAAIGRYYQRMGMLLALMHLLDGTDIHSENLIAQGEYPVIIDCETLMTPRLEGWDFFTNPITAEEIAEQQLRLSSLRTSMLPHHSSDNMIDLSAIGAVGGQTLTRKYPLLVNVNQDNMKFVMQEQTTTVHKNLPRLNGKMIPVRDYIDDVTAGYAEIYRLIQRDPVAFIAQLPTENIPGRFLLRQTDAYAHIQQQMTQPKMLRDGHLAGEVLQQLAHLHHHRDKAADTYPLLEAEHAAMQHWNIPLFMTYSQSPGIYDDSGTALLRDYFLRSGYSEVVTRLQNLSAADLAWQLNFIKTTLQLNIDPQPANIVEILPDEDNAVSDKDFFEQAARNIADDLTDTAIRGKDESITWLMPRNTGTHYAIGTPGVDLYDGYAGIALFFAALEHLNLHPDAESLTRAMLHPVQVALSDSDQKSIGAASGYGGLVYSLFTVGRLLQDAALITDAITAALSIPDEHLASDKALDILGGCAGYLLVLLALYEHTLNPDLLQKAKICGDRLLAQQQESGAWQGVFQMGLSGFSHGVAGIAYALLRLYSITDDDVLYHAALQGIAYENTLFAPDAGNWRDLRDENGISYMTAWCHGAAGIALARAAGLQFTSDEQMQKDAMIACQTTAKMLENPAPFSDHICCGNSGRIESMLFAGQIMNQADFIEKSQSAGRNMVHYAEAAGGYRYGSGLQRGIIMPGFFQGAAGIGYQLLRLAYPDKLPCVLLWQ